MMSDARRAPGEAYYIENGWSGCAGSAWHTLPPAAKDGWAHAERIVAGLQYRMAQAWDEDERWRRARGGLPAVLGDPNPYRGNPDSHNHDAAARVREWVEREVSDWYDPVIEPDLNDALRVIVGLPPHERDDGGRACVPPKS